MTDKLPVIGKKYKTESGIIEIMNYGIYYKYDGDHEMRDNIDYNFNHQFKTLEELPGQEPATEKQYPYCKYEFLCKICDNVVGTDMAYYFEQKRCCGCGEPEPTTKEFDPEEDDKNFVETALLDIEINFEVQKALEELKKQLEICTDHLTETNYPIGDIEEKAQNLINALEKQKGE